MLKKRWLNAVHMLSACHPCLSGDVWRCRRWLGRRLFHIALHGSVLIESGCGLSSGGYVCDVVPSDQTMVEHDTCLKKALSCSCGNWPNLHGGVSLSPQLSSSSDASVLS